MHQSNRASFLALCVIFQASTTNTETPTCCPGNVDSKCYFNGMAISRNETVIDCNDCDTVYIREGEDLNLFCHICQDEHRKGLSIPTEFLILGTDMRYLHSVQKYDQTGLRDEQSQDGNRIEWLEGKQFVQKGSKLTIANTKLSNDGWYSCTTTISHQSITATREVKICSVDATLPANLSYFDCDYTIDLNSHERANCSYGVAKSYSNCNISFSNVTCEFIGTLFAESQVKMRTNQCDTRCETNYISLHLMKIDDPVKLNIHGISPLEPPKIYRREVILPNHYLPSVKPVVLPGEVPGSLSIEIRQPQRLDSLKGITYFIDIRFYSNRNDLNEQLHHQEELYTDVYTVLNGIRVYRANISGLAYNEPYRWKIQYKMKSRGKLSHTFTGKAKSSPSPPSAFPVKGVAFVPKLDMIFYSPWTKEFIGGADNLKLYICTKDHQKCHSLHLTGVIDLSDLRREREYNTSIIALQLQNDAGRSLVRNINLSNVTVNENENDPQITPYNEDANNFVEICWNRPTVGNQTIVYGWRDIPHLINPYFLHISCKSSHNCELEENKRPLKMNNVAQLKFSPGQLKYNKTRICVRSEKVATDQWPGRMFAIVSNCNSKLCYGNEPVSLKKCSGVNTSISDLVTTRLHRDHICISISYTCASAFFAYKAVFSGGKSEHAQALKFDQNEPCGPSEAAVHCSGNKKDARFQIIGVDLNQKKITSPKIINPCMLSITKSQFPSLTKTIIIVVTVSILAAATTASLAISFNRRPDLQDKLRECLGLRSHRGYEMEPTRPSEPEDPPPPSPTWSDEGDRYEEIGPLIPLAPTHDNGPLGPLEPQENSTPPPLPRFAVPSFLEQRADTTQQSEQEHLTAWSAPNVAIEPSEALLRYSSEPELHSNSATSTTVI